MTALMTSLGPKIGQALGAVKTAGLSAPGAAIGGLLGAEFIGAPLVKGGLRTLDQARTEVLTGKTRGERLFEKGTEAFFDKLLIQQRTEALEKRVGEKALELATLYPDIYTRVVAGRALPRGARVFGGAKRVDLLRELALEMAQRGTQ